MLNRLKDIAESYGVADIYLFGSRAAEVAARIRGAEEPSESSIDSDLDIGVYCKPGVRLDAAGRVNLMAELEDLFAVNRVDLVMLSEAEPFIALDIIRGELIYSEDLDRQARYELFALRRAGDLLPFKKERIRLILEGGGRCPQP